MKAGEVGRESEVVFGLARVLRVMSRVAPALFRNIVTKQRS